MRYSHQRELILKEVKKRKDYPTAELICATLRAECPRLSLGTVYRDLNTLVEVGKIRRVSIPGKADRFDGQTNVHEHFYCRTCGQVTDLPISTEYLEELHKQRPDIQIEDYLVTVIGECEECAQKH